MIKYILVSLVLLGCCPAEPSITLKDFVKLIPQWEVYPNSPHDVVGDNGAAYGHYQIHKVMAEHTKRVALAAWQDRGLRLDNTNNKAQ